MAEFVFDKMIFQMKFIQADGFKNRAKSMAPHCDSICPNNSDSANTYKGYSSVELLADILHNVFGEVLSVKKAADIREDLRTKIINSLTFEDETLKDVFVDIFETMYFGDNADTNMTSTSLLRYSPASVQKDFGKFVYDVFLDDETKDKLEKVILSNSNPLDDIVNDAYTQLNVLQAISEDKEYSRLFCDSLSELFLTMNKDFRAALDNPTDAISELEFLFSFYLFIYLSQIALRFDSDLHNKVNSDEVQDYPLFKGAKESISEDRACLVNGWRRVEKKTQKIFKHMIVLNMLNCHTNDSPYLTYSDLYKIYSQNELERAALDDAIEYIIDQYTVQYSHDTDDEGVNVAFPDFVVDSNASETERFIAKVQYLYECVSLQLESKTYRRNVVGYVAGNYNHILKMRFVKSWGSYGAMMMITNEDLITMISICQRTSDRMIHERGIQISDLFMEFQKRGLCMDAKTKQYIIDYLIQINLIDSKCDSEEAQYVKRIQ